MLETFAEDDTLEDLPDPATACVLLQHGVFPMLPMLPSSNASRRSVLTRSLLGRAIDKGATTSRCTPCARRWRRASPRAFVSYLAASV